MLERLLRAFDLGRDLFWIAALGVLLVFGFFLMLGADDADEGARRHAEELLEAA